METWPSPSTPTLPGHAPGVRLYDAETSRPTPLAVGDVARMYVCGITPYDATHLGHAFTYITFDLLNRLWRDAGHQVEYVQNVTDIDDPLLERAVATGQDWRELADRETALFRADMAALRVLPPSHYVGAVESMHLVASAVSALRSRGAVYQVDDDLYFDLSTDDRFGDVARLGAAEMLSLCAERGGDPQRAGKRHPLDPLLWQAARPDEPAWDTPLGHGRPGWHIECTAIAVEHLGMTFDVQGGGSDLAYPHHEMCASLAHVATGRWPFARRYVHAAMVGLHGHKMSKSRGNLVFVSRLLAAGWPAGAVRLALLEHHYRTDWEWEDGALDTATARYEQWCAAAQAPGGPSAQGLLEDVRTALADDLDAPTALRVVDRWVQRVHRGHGEDPSAPRLVADVVDALLGIDLRAPAVSRPVHGA